MDEKSVLGNLRLFTEEGHLKNVRVLFFAKNSRQFIDAAKIRCVLFKGINKRYILDDKVMDGILLDQYEAAMGYLKNKLELRYDIEGQGAGPRKEYLEIPEIALKEALVNALLCKHLHKSRYVNGNIM